MWNGTITRPPYLKPTWSQFFDSVSNWPNWRHRLSTSACSFLSLCLHGWWSRQRKQQQRGWHWSSTRLEISLKDGGQINICYRSSFFIEFIRLQTRVEVNTSKFCKETEKATQVTFDFLSGIFKMDLTGTGMRFVTPIDWSYTGNRACSGNTPNDYTVSSTKQRVSGRCGGRCGGCAARSLVLKPINCWRIWN